MWETLKENIGKAKAKEKENIGKEKAKAKAKAKEKENIRNSDLFKKKEALLKELILMPHLPVLVKNLPINPPDI